MFGKWTFAAGKNQRPSGMARFGASSFVWIFKMKKPANRPKANELFPQLAVEKTEHTSTASRHLRATTNQRHIRGFVHLIRNPYGTFKTALGPIIGAANPAQSVLEMRGLGLGCDPKTSDLQCKRIPVLDRDGKVTRPGRYFLTPRGRREVLVLLARLQITLTSEV